MTDLANASGLSASRMTRLVDDLQIRGLVTKRTSSEDGHANVAKLTPAGLASTTSTPAPLPTRRKPFPRSPPNSRPAASPSSGGSPMTSSERNCLPANRSPERRHPYPGSRATSGVPRPRNRDDHNHFEPQRRPCLAGPRSLAPFTGGSDLEQGERGNTPRIAVILGSTRPGRRGEQVARWVMDQARHRTEAVRARRPRRLPPTTSGRATAAEHGHVPEHRGPGTTAADPSKNSLGEAHYRKGAPTSLRWPPVCTLLTS
jgi:hypothetical protein